MEFPQSLLSEYCIFLDVSNFGGKHGVSGDKDLLDDVGEVDEENQGKEDGDCATKERAFP